MNKVIGQTGSVVLSDDAVFRKLSEKRTVCYRYVRMTRSYYRAEVVGPFHSAYYGLSSFGTTRLRAKAALIRCLANSFGYMGRLIFSVDDEADHVGEVDSPVMCEGAII